MRKILFICTLLYSILSLTSCAINSKVQAVRINKKYTIKTTADLNTIYNKLNKGNWKQQFFDTGTTNWKEYWSLDGKKGTVKNSKNGMIFAAGPNAGNHADHAVLWTKKNFSGDIKIEFDYTRLDSSINNYVNILYIQATGTGKGKFKKDILAWQDLRKIPYMKSYFDNMNLLHISFAANPATDDYIRARRYPRQKKQDFGKTELKPDYLKVKLFSPNKLYHIVCIKRDRQLIFSVTDMATKLTKRFYWDLTQTKPISYGRVGIRHMYSRTSRYKNFKISTLP